MVLLALCFLRTPLRKFQSTKWAFDHERIKDETVISQKKISMTDGTSEKKNHFVAKLLFFKNWRQEFDFHHQGELTLLSLIKLIGGQSTFRVTLFQRKNDHKFRPIRTLRNGLALEVETCGQAANRLLLDIFCDFIYVRCQPR